MDKVILGGNESALAQGQGQANPGDSAEQQRSEEHTSELQSH